MTRLDEAAGSGFRTIQTGAAFQEREGYDNKNGLLWCELNDIQHGLYAHPRQWSHEFQNWVVDGTAFPPDYRIPNRDLWRLPVPQDTHNEHTELLDPMAGWRLMDRSILESERGKTTDALILKYFNGRIPSIDLAASPKIPRREVVRRVINGINGPKCKGPIIVNILGAAGEGKSTALLQCMVGLVETGSGWRALVKYDESARLSLELFEVLRAGGGQWLLVVDDADLVAQEIFAAAEGLSNSQRDDVVFLLAARDTDWRHLGQKGKSHGNWSREYGYQFKSLYSEELLKGLSELDARAIVSAWSAFGNEGLGQLSELAISEAAERLFNEAKEEAIKHQHEGSFLGALLRVRVGEDLKPHIATLLARLDHQFIESTGSGSRAKTLRDAVAYIAAMHAENYLYLSKQVLAQVLGCELGEVRPEILTPLGEETLLDVPGQRILVRHRAVAEVIIEILAAQWGFDPDEALADLVKAVEQLRNHGEIVEHFEGWRKLAFYLCDRGKPALAVRLAKIQVQESRNDPYVWTSLANLYIKLEKPEFAVETLRGMPANLPLTRRRVSTAAIIFEKAANFGESALLNWLALSDGVEVGQMGLRQGKLNLLYLSNAMYGLWSLRPAEDQLKGSASAATLFNVLEDDPSLHFKVGRQLTAAEDHKILLRDKLDAFKTLRSTMQSLAPRISGTLPQWAQSIPDATFIQLARLLSIHERYGV